MIDLHEQLEDSGQHLRRDPNAIISHPEHSLLPFPQSGYRNPPVGLGILGGIGQEIADDLGLYGELHRFIPVLAKLQGARITQVDVKHHPRKFGKSKYGIGRTFRVLSDLVLMVFFRKYMQKPMHLFGTLGFFSFGLGLLINAYLLVLKILGHDIWGKPILILGLIFLLGGIQLITIGILAEIAVRTYYESQSKKTYQVRKVHQKERVPETLEITV